MIDAVRLDKWLWAARFFKTRRLAADAIAGGKVHTDGERAKPAHAVRPGSELRIRKGPVEWTVVVAAVSDRRGSASEAQALYAETDDSRLRREAVARERRVVREAAAAGRPDKHDRRRLRRLKGR